MADLAPGSPHGEKREGKWYQGRGRQGTFLHLLYYKDTGVSFEADNSNKMEPWEKCQGSGARIQAGVFLGLLLLISAVPFLFPGSLFPLPLYPSATCSISIIQVQLSKQNRTLFFLIPFLIPGGTWMKPTRVCYPLLVQSVMAGNWDNTLQNKKSARVSLLWMRREQRVSTWAWKILPKVTFPV